MRKAAAYWLLAGLAAGALVCAGGGCKRSDKDKSRAPKASEAGGSAPPASVEAELPSYELPPELEERHPDLVAFLKQFLETCYAGDYAGYRLMVVREENPESRERFETIVRSVSDIRVESIEQLQAGTIPGSGEPVFLVVTQVEFKPESRVALRRTTRKLAILALKERGEWRMAPAPAALQPRNEAIGEGSAETQPVETTFFPWDDGGGS